MTTMQDKVFSKGNKPETLLFLFWQRIKVFNFEKTKFVTKNYSFRWLSKNQQKLPVFKFNCKFVYYFGDIVLFETFFWEGDQFFFVQNILICLKALVLWTLYFGSKLATDLSMEMWQKPTLILLIFNAFGSPNLAPFEAHLWV